MGLLLQFSAQSSTTSSDSPANRKVLLVLFRDPHHVYSRLPILGILGSHSRSTDLIKRISFRRSLRICGGFCSCELFPLVEYKVDEADLWFLRGLFFFGGLSIHLSTALLTLMFSYNMFVFSWLYLSQAWLIENYRTWGSTVKEVERSIFWIEGKLWIHMSVTKFFLTANIIT
jgi:hypothetical protein